MHLNAGGGAGSQRQITPIFSGLLVEEYASRWQVPLPQLRVLEIALRYFSRASTFFTTNCDHVQHTIGSLALSIFELLLYFDQKDFCEEPLKNFTATFQECHLVLAKYQNVYLLQVECLVQDGGPWASPALQAILSDSSLPQNEVDCFISSELPVLFELRVRYLSSCGHVSEAVALAKCCVRHPAARQHLFFHQMVTVSATGCCLFRCLAFVCRFQVADINGKDAVHIICSLECEETDKLLLALSSAFLSQQLQRGDMYYLCDLVRVWTNLHSRLNTSKRALLDECRRLMFSATNVKSIFPFIRAILQEVGEDGIQFCVELCANALQSCLPCDVLTKALIYKTIAALLPNDLEVSRACALLVFFLERTVESYKIVYLLYMIPDQEYPVDDSPIGNNVRFETLQVLKKDLPFDPEFWNLIALRTNCLKLLSEKVVSADSRASPDKAKTSEQEVSVVDRGEKKVKATQDALSDIPENIELMETLPEPEESKLEHYCTFCNKDFKGSRVVEHAMFHYRKDECTFCRLIFKDDLLAMMHLSDHIEKLKRCKDQDNGDSVTKDTSSPKTSAKAKTTNMPSGCQGKEKGRKISVCSESIIDHEGAPSSRLQRKHLETDSSVQTDKDLNFRENKRKKELPKNLKTTSVQNVEKKTTEPEEKLCCPMDGCSWFTDLSKNRVTLLYHALEKHYGENEPLELAFRVSDNKCSICMRVLCSFEHFQHHVRRHRLVPRHPCLHRGCTERFKTGMEMRRHARKHNPLQATCCLPGCSQLFICLWALNLHEREHYSSKSVKPEKNTNVETGDKLCKTPVSKKPHESKGKTSTSKSISKSKSDPKQQEKAKGAAMILQGLQRLIKSTLDEKEKRKEASRASAPSSPTDAANKTCSSSGPEDDKPEVDKTQLVGESSDDTEDTNPSETSSSVVCGCSQTLNREALSDDVTFIPCKETLAKYSKKPYMRLPPTAYLDEKFITMPKRRKELLLHRCPVGAAPEPASVKTAQQRHRCANCFATFSSTEELRGHVERQKCSNLFGFDSDDEGERAV
uniref:Uncharacterized LOC108245010 n=1 Tax=Kryptolebias marmoratus TaxID=37003 RepID=A0A3Q3EGA2_KRYMA